MKKQNSNHVDQRYPAFPSWAQFGGRVIHLDFEKSKLVLSVNSKEISISLPQEEIQKLKLFDLIAVGKNNEIQVLTSSILNEKIKYPQWNLEQYKLWNLFLFKIRSYFMAQDFVETPTPSLVSCPGTEPSLEVFKTELVVDSKKKTLFLPTSPELTLKKYLAYGADKIFEIKPCFRNGEITERHQPEFTMIEWYRAFSDLNGIQKDVEGLISYLVQDQDLKNIARKLNWKIQEKTPEFENVTIEKLFRNIGKTFKPQTSQEELRSWMSEWGFNVQGNLSIDDCFFIIMNEKIETQISPEKVTVLKNYPPYQAALARVTEDGWGDRFEVYWNGLELANAFHELNDPQIQRERSKEDLHKKQNEGRSEIGLDEDFFKALEIGMPPSGGIALGLERLFMALFDRKNIRDCKPFSYENL